LGGSWMSAGRFPARKNIAIEPQINNDVLKMLKLSLLRVAAKGYMPMKRNFILYIVIVLSFFSVLYGVTYQQFRHFDVTDPRGYKDALSYIKMSHGDYNVNPIHRYRFVIPVIAEYLRLPLKHFVHSEDTLDTLPFYIINFAFSLTSALLLLELLQCIGFKLWWSILGVIVFMTSRVTIAMTGCPLIDSFFLTSILLILLLTIKGKSGYLALFMPLLALSKETIILFLLLPLFTKIRNSKCYIFSLFVSFGTLYLGRYVVDRTASIPSPGFIAIVQMHMNTIWFNFTAIFTLGGLHNLLNGFCFFLPFAVAGFYINCRHKIYTIPLFLQLLFPISLFYALLSGNLGRMLFIGFPVVIPYALIFIEFVYQQSSARCKIEDCPTRE
jgi:hypothetical protein